MMNGKNNGYFDPLGLSALSDDHRIGAKANLVVISENLHDAEGNPGLLLLPLVSMLQVQALSFRMTQGQGELMKDSKFNQYLETAYMHLGNAIIRDIRRAEQDGMVRGKNPYNIFKKAIEVIIDEGLRHATEEIVGWPIEGWYNILNKPK